MKYGKKTYGGTNVDSAFSLVHTRDGGYAIAGLTKSFGVGLDDFWLVKTDSNGNIMWDQTLEGSGQSSRSLVQTNAGEYAIAGSTTHTGAGQNDFWLIKMSETEFETSDITPYVIIIVVAIIAITSFIILRKRRKK